MSLHDAEMPLRKEKKKNSVQQLKMTKKHVQNVNFLEQNKLIENTRIHDL